MIEFGKESVITIDAAATLAGVNRSTIYAWMRRGQGRKSLRTAKLGGKRITSVEAINEFQTGGESSADREIRSRVKEQRQARVKRSASRASEHDAAMERLASRHKLRTV